jgi:hypothetical protein
MSRAAAEIVAIVARGSLIENIEHDFPAEGCGCRSGCTLPALGAGPLGAGQRRLPGRGDE